jgi:hypothetical protein
MSTNTTVANTPSDLRIDKLRAAVWMHRVVFPAPVPVFSRQSRHDVQWRMAALYFVHGWSPQKLGDRYGVSARRIRQLVKQWVRRAMTLGYLQEVPTRNICAASEKPRSALAHDALMLVLGRQPGSDAPGASQP